jgi:tetratricopeptide (TPR) repeat protein
MRRHSLSLSGVLALFFGVLALALTWERSPAQEGGKAPVADARPKPRPPRGADRGEAERHVARFLKQRNGWLVRDWWEWSAVAGAAPPRLGGGGPLGGTVNVALQLGQVRGGLAPPDTNPGKMSPAERTVFGLWPGYLAGEDAGQPVLLLRAVQAARRAVAADPDDAGAYLVLGQAYLLLSVTTRERSWQLELPQLRALRRAQAAEALNRAIRLRPKLAEAHLALAELYALAGYLDWALEHIRAYAKAGALAGEAPDVAKVRLAKVRKDVKRLEGEVQKRRNRFEEAGRLRILARAQRARALGLAGTALQMWFSATVADQVFAG